MVLIFLAVFGPESAANKEDPGKIGASVTSPSEVKQ